MSTAIVSELSYINQHRIAVGRPVFTSLTDEQLQHHLQLINQHAPYGNDPWADDYTYQLFITDGHDGSAPHSWSYGKPVKSIAACSELVEELQHKFEQLQEACDADDVRNDWDAVRRLREAADAAVANYEGCYVFAKRSDGALFAEVDSGVWEQVHHCSCSKCHQVVP